jgi:hypothetical protein
MARATPNGARRVQGASLALLERLRIAPFASARRSPRATGSGVREPIEEIMRIATYNVESMFRGPFALNQATLGAERRPTSRFERGNRPIITGAT